MASVKGWKFHLHIPLKLMTSGLGPFLNAYRRNSKLETKPNNPKGFAFSNFSNFSTAWTTAVFLYKFHLTTARATRRGKQWSAIGNKNSTWRCSKGSSPVLLQARLWPQTHWFSSCCARTLEVGLSFFILRGTERNYEPTRTKRFLCTTGTSK